MGVWGYLPSRHPCLVWEAFRMPQRRLGPDTASCLPHRVWPVEVSQSQGGDHLLWESDWGLVAQEQGPGLLHHRQVHPGRQSRWQKTDTKACEWPRQARLPSPGHPPKWHFGRSTWKVPSGSHPHLLRWFPTTVRSPQGLNARVCPHQPPLNATELQTRRCGPSGHWQHLRPKVCAPQSICGSQKMWLWRGRLRALFTRGRLRCPRRGRPWPVAGQRQASLHAHGTCSLPCQAWLQATKKDLTPSTAPRHDDPLSRHPLSNLNGGGGSGKTTWAIELFRTRNPLVFTPTQGRPGPDI